MRVSDWALVRKFPQSHLNYSQNLCELRRVDTGACMPPTAFEGSLGGRWLIGTEPWAECARSSFFSYNQFKLIALQIPQV